MTSKDLLLTDLRKLYAKVKKTVDELELQNRDARVRGESYTARKPLQSRISTGLAVMRDIEAKANEIKRRPLPAPDSDTVERHGMENALRIEYLGGIGYTLDSFTSKS